MLSRQSALALPCLALASIPRAQDEYQPKPIPAEESAYTQRQLLLDNGGIWTDLLLAEVRLGEGESDESKALAEQLLSIYGRVVATWNFDADERTRAFVIIDRVREAKSNDPVLQLASADLLSFSGRIEDAGLLFEQAKARLRGRRSALLQCRLAMSLSAFYAKTDQLASQRRAAERGVEHAIEFAASPAAVGKERFCLAVLLGAFGGDVGANDGDFLARLEKRVGEPNYVTLVLRGQYHDRRAWAARGTGWSSTVSDSAYRTVGEELQDATRALVAAHEMNPDLPEAPGLLVGVLGLAGADHAELRRWFDRAVAAQFDYGMAYQKLLNYAQPRWGGSQRLLRSFGEECLETGRFDTSVPNNYRVAISHMVRDGAGFEIWTDEEVRANLARINDQTLAASTDFGLLQYIRTCKVIDLMLAEEMAAAAALAREMEFQFTENALRVYGMESEWLKTALRPFDRDYRPLEVARTDLFAGFEQGGEPGVESARPLASQCDGVTYLQWRSGLADWIGAAFADAYRQVRGVKAEEGDLASGFVRDIGRILIGPRPANADERAQRLIDEECDDPLVRYAIVRALGDDPKAVRMLRQLLPELEAEYPPLFSWWALQHMRNLARQADRSDIASALIPAVREKIVAAASDPAFVGAGASNFIAEIFGTGDLTAKRNDWFNDEMVEAIQRQPDVDPWLTDMVVGLHHVRRGLHFAETDRARGRDLQIAARHLRAAHERRPETPEAASAMVRVAAVLRDPDERTPREWFDRSVACVIDYQPAYVAFADALRPGYGGSIQAMFRFGVECLETERFDLEVPIWFVRCLSRVQDEVAEPRQVWAADGVAPKIAHFFDSSAAEPAGFAALIHSDIPSGRCILAWAGGRYGDALAAWRRAGKELGQTWVPYVSGADLQLIQLDLELLDKARDR